MNKYEHWDSIKSNFLSHIPEQYSPQVTGLDKEDTYYHVSISIDDTYSIVGQSHIKNEKSDYSSDSDNIYALRLEAMYAHNYQQKSLSFDIGDYKQMEKILFNWQEYKPFIDKYLAVQKAICDNIDVLSNIRSTIQTTILQEKFNKDEQARCVKDLMEVKNFIEDERMIEKFGGR